MPAKLLLAICAFALFIQFSAAQTWNRAPLAGTGFKAWDGCGCGAGLRAPFAYDAPCGYGAGADIAAASSLNAAWGGGLQVSSSSPIPPTGLSVVSENAYEGSLILDGNLPFLGTVVLEGAFPSVGAGAINYACGNGAVGITAESHIGSIAPAAAIAPAAGIASPLGVGYGYNGRNGACGCNGVY